MIDDGDIESAKSATVRLAFALCERVLLVPGTGVLPVTWMVVVPGELGIVTFIVEVPDPVTEAGVKVHWIPGGFVQLRLTVALNPLRAVTVTV